ncbi:MAG: cytochrome b N-terminal domain-containing protein [Bacillota bacterium]
MRTLTRRRGFLSHGRPGWVPASAARFRYTYGLGGASVLLFLLLLVTGLPLLFQYQPGDGAYRSLANLTYVLPYGWLFRSLHFWAAQMLVVTVLFHLLRVALTRAFLPPRRFNWWLGVGLLVLVVGLDYTGYLLRGDLEAVSAATVGWSILRSVPVVGQALAALIFGSGGQGALLGLSAWHSSVFPLAGFGVMGWHLWHVRRDGGISRPAADDGTHIPLSQLAAREWVAGLAVANLVLLLALLLPPGLGLAPDQPSVAPVPAPWVFGAVQVLLHRLSPFVAGVAVPLAAVLLLGSAPYLEERRPWLGRTLVLAVATCFTALTLYFWWQV